MRCATCGLVNYQGSAVCRRCQSPLGAPSWGAPVPQPPTSYTTQGPPPYGAMPPPPPQYGAMPPPQYGGMPGYGTPFAFAGPPAGTGVWSDGGTLVMHKQAQLPDRCIKCNDQARGRRLNRQLWYMNPILYVLAVSPIIFLIVYMVVRKGAKVEVGVCEAHARQRRNLIAAGWALFAVTILAFVLAFYVGNSPVLFVAALVLFLATVVVAIIPSRFVMPGKIDDHYVWLKGVCPDYLASLPPARGL